MPHEVTISALIRRLEHLKAVHGDVQVLIDRDDELQTEPEVAFVRDAREELTGRDFGPAVVLS